MEYILKIESNFTDKNNGKKYRIGETVTFDEARAMELLRDSRNLVSLVTEKKVTKPRKTKNSKSLV